MPRYLYYCYNCDNEFEVYNVRINDRDKLQPCPNCRECSERVFEGCTNVMQVSYPDGWRRQHHQDWQTMRAYQKLRRERMQKSQYDVEERSRITKEMDEVSKVHQPKWEAPLYDGSINDHKRDRLKPGESKKE